MSQSSNDSSVLTSSTSHEFADQIRSIAEQISTIDEDNRRIKHQIEEIEGFARSRGFRLIDRGLKDLIGGNATQRRHFTHDLIYEARSLVRSWADRFKKKNTPPNTIASELLRFKDELDHHRETMRIAVTSFGGIGDTICLTPVLEAIKKKYVDSKIYVVLLHREANREVFRGNGYVAGVYYLRDGEGALRDLLRSGSIDIWFEYRFVTRVHFAPGNRVPPAEQAAIAAEIEPFNRYFDQFPHTAYLLSEFGKTKGWRAYDFANRTAQLRIEDPQYLIVPSSEDVALTGLMQELGDYITIHHGYDRTTAGIKPNEYQTKNWFRPRWEQTIAELKSRGYKVVQVGGSDDELLSGAIHAFVGRTSLQETGIIIKHALFHLDTEGGLVHLARAVHTRSVVLFGPTPVWFFGYLENMNLTAGGCQDCWWSVSDWQQRCPRDLPVPSCMDEISIEQVVAAAEEMRVGVVSARRHRYSLLDIAFFDENKIGRSEEVLREIYRAGELQYERPGASAMNDVTGTYIHGSKNWEYLYVVEQLHRLGPDRSLKVLDVGAGRGALSLYLAERGHDSHICDLEYSAHSHNGINYGSHFLAAITGKVNYRFGSVFNLPYDSETFDVVTSVSVIEHLEHKQFAISEMLRVLRPGGLLVLTYDLMPEHAQMAAFADGNRVEIFTERKLGDTLSKFGINYVSRPAAVDEACRLIQECQMNGIPNGLTVGALCIQKQ